MSVDFAELGVCDAPSRGAEIPGLLFVAPSFWRGRGAGGGRVDPLPLRPPSVDLQHQLGRVDLGSAVTLSGFGD